MKKYIIKSVIITLTNLLIITSIQAQAPEKMSYQAVIRDGSDVLITSTVVGMRIQIIQGSEFGAAIYVETQTPTSNANGLVSLEIGGGTVVSGTFSTIDWANGPYFIKTETDPAGGTNYTITGTSQLLSVPYALHAKSASSIDGLPATFDTDSTNELQNLSFNSATGELTISSGNSITLPLSTGGDNWGNQTVVSDLSLSGDGTASNPLTVNGALTDNQTLTLSGTTLSISNGNNVNLSSINSDNQTLSLSGSNLSISGGNTVTLPTGSAGDNWGSQTVVSDATLSGNGTNTNPLRIAPQGAVSGQILKWNGSQWFPGADEVGTDTSHWDKSTNYIFTRHDSVGIGLYSSLGNIYPKARLHVQNGNVIFGTGNFKIEYLGTYLDFNLGNQFKWDESKGSVRLGVVFNPLIASEWLPEGSFSFSAGDRSQASGTGATAFGRLSIAQGPNSFAAGDSAIAISNSSISIGHKTISSGALSTAIGYITQASGIASTALGWNTKSSGAGATSMGVNSIAQGERSFAAGDSSVAIGYGSIAFGTKTRATGQNSFAAGNNSLASGNFSFAMGSENTTASGYNSVAMGYQSTSSGFISVAIGNGATAAGHSAVAIGQSTTASAYHSTAMGSISYALGSYSTALGANVIARSAYETVLGRYNLDYTPASTTGWNVNDPLFVIGNGTAFNIKSNAIMVLKNGKTAIGNITPQTNLHIYHGTINAGSAPLLGLRLENSGANNSYWTIYTANANGYLYLYSKDGGNTAVGSFNSGTGAYAASSNKFLKTDISNLEANTLSKVMQLDPARYRYLRDPNNQFTIGFIAEDVKPFFPELVETIGEEKENMAINYAGFSVVAIKAIQEQQALIEDLQERIKLLEELVKK